jgi:myo-inositol catabolism protein IolC
MTLGYTAKLYLLAFDHRSSFSKGLFGLKGEPTPEELAQIQISKQIIFEGLQKALPELRGIPHDVPGLLTDEEYGGEVARQAKIEGLTLAMPVEKSGQAEFDFEYGAAYRDHIRRFDPTFVKVLVRYNPEGDRDLNRRQLDRLADLSDWLHGDNRKFLFELLVPATAEQLAKVGGSTDRYDLELRPDLVVRTIQECQQAHVEPDIWKIEGLERREDSVRVADTARAGGRDQVCCIVLGRGASEAKVDHWLQVGATVPGYQGFAVGRTIWEAPLTQWVAGSLDRGAAAQRISANYRHLIDVYEEAAKQAARS